MKTAFTIKSSAFVEGEQIPQKYTGESKDISPPLEWSGVPQGTLEFALICEDPDAPRPEPWVHWLIYKLKRATTRLPEGIEPKKIIEIPVSADQGLNSFDKIGYNGPMPPPGHGWHRYFFRLYALDAPLGIHSAATKDELFRAMEGHIIQHTETFGRYKRESSHKRVA